MLAQRDRTPTLRRATIGVSILSGIVRCAGCSFAMKPQAAGRTSPAIYRCTTVSTHGRCPEPSTIAKARIEDYVVEHFVEQYPLRFAATSQEDERAVLERAAYAAELAYRQQLDNTELRDMIGGADHDRLVGTLHRDWQHEARRHARGTSDPRDTGSP